MSHAGPVLPPAHAELTASAGDGLMKLLSRLFSMCLNQHDLGPGNPKIFSGSLEDDPILANLLDLPRYAHLCAVDIVSGRWNRQAGGGAQSAPLNLNRTNLPHER